MVLLPVQGQDLDMPQSEPSKGFSCVGHTRPKQRDEWQAPRIGYTRRCTPGDSATQETRAYRRLNLSNTARTSFAMRISVRGSGVRWQSLMHDSRHPGPH